VCRKAHNERRHALRAGLSQEKAAKVIPLPHAFYHFPAPFHNKLRKQIGIIQDYENHCNSYNCHKSRNDPHNPQF